MMLIMTTRLIILRGNSGSGKTTIARRLQRELEQGAMLISQDVVRREILQVNDAVGNPSIALMEKMAAFGSEIGKDVIIEGILSRKKYHAMLQRVMETFDKTYVYYFDIPFDETLRRHALKPNAHEFGEKEMRDWWHEKDMLCNDDRIISSDASEDDTMTRIHHDIGTV